MPVFLKLKTSLLAPVVICLCGICFVAAGAPAAVDSGSPASQKPGITHEGWIDFNKNGKRDVFEDSSQDIEKRVEDLLAQMTVEEKTCQLATLYGYGRVLKDPLPTPKWKDEIWKDGIANIDEMHNGFGKFNTPARNPILASPATTARAINAIQRWFIEETRLGIPVDFTNEGVRGLNAYRSTNFPSNIAMGATWNPPLFGQIGHVIGREARALGYTNVYAPIMDLCRDPRWGRVLECYSEDPFLVARMGIAMAGSIQAEGVSSTAKHFGVYSEPKGGRDGDARTDPHVAPREMEMLHLWPWEQLVRETGLRGVMSSYNDYDGIPISGGREFLIDRLRDQWGFRGYVVSDSNAVEFLSNKHRVAATPGEAAAMYLREGGNVRTNFTPPSDFILLVRKEIAEGRLAMSVVDDRVRDVLRVKFAAGIFDRPYVADPDRADKIIHAPESAALALEAARQSIVLLKNENNALPLSKSLKRILVTGPEANMKETSYDRYGSSGAPVVSLIEGIRAALPKTEIVFSEGAKVADANWPESELYHEPPPDKDLQMIAQAVKAAADVDAIVVGVGDSDDTVGESKSRTSLDLPGLQTDLVKALVATGKPVVVVLMTGRPASINWINRHVPAIIEAWFPGEAGGTAIAEVLFGDFNPGGKLPMTFPRTVGQVPMNFPFKPGSQNGQSKKVDPNGFGHSMAEGVLYPFGYGLSYTTFSYEDLRVGPATVKADGEVTISFTLKNTGTRAGDEVPQLYVQDVVSSVTTYDLNLRGFERVRLQPGEAKTVTFTLPASSMWLINRSGKRVVEPGEFKVFIGSSSEDIRLNGAYKVVE